MPTPTATSIYVNAATARLKTAIHGKDVSAPLTDHKRWTRGYELFKQAKSRGQFVPLVFASTIDLAFCAIATDMTLGESATTFRFSNLRKLRGHRRSDLILESSGEHLEDMFIRSYALVKTPPFVVKVLAEESDDSIDEEFSMLEGELRRRMVAHRKREKSLRNAKLLDVLGRTGRLACEVPNCGFDFYVVYGEIGREYAHVHHLTPLASKRGVRKTRLEDLAIVCANCHAMLHRGGESRDLKTLVRKKLLVTGGSR